MLYFSSKLWGNLWERVDQSPHHCQPTNLKVRPDWDTLYTGHQREQRDLPTIQHPTFRHGDWIESKGRTSSWQEPIRPCDGSLFVILPLWTPCLLRIWICGQRRRRHQQRDEIKTTTTTTTTTNAAEKQLKGTLLYYSTTVMGRPPACFRPSARRRSRALPLMITNDD